MQSKEGSQGGVAFFVSLYSLLRDKPAQAGLVILGEMTIQGNILPVRSSVEPLQVIMDNGAKRVLSLSAIDASISKCRRTSWSGWIRSSTRSHWPPR